MFVQMNAVVSHHVVLVTGIDEVIGMRAVLDARFQKLQAVLPNNGRVFIAMNNQ